MAAPAYTLSPNAGCVDDDVPGLAPNMLLEDLEKTARLAEHGA